MYIFLIPLSRTKGFLTKRKKIYNFLGRILNFKSKSNLNLI